MQAEVNWQQAYEELQRKVQFVMEPLLKRALAHVEEDPRSVQEFRDTIAPKGMDLPPIMTMFTPREREKLFEKLDKKTANGKWTASVNKQGRPCFSMVTARARLEQVAGKRATTTKVRTKSSKVSGRQWKYLQKSNPQVTVFTTHAVLVRAGQFPTEVRNFASHICHRNDCIDLRHLLWEDANTNLRRERMCRKVEDGECHCGAEPPCDFSLHKEDE